MPVTSTPSSGLTSGAHTSLTWSHTSNTDPLYVFLSWFVDAGAIEAADMVTGITFNGVALTRGGQAAVPGNTLEWWRLAAPTATTANVVITLASARKISAGALNLSGWPTALADHTIGSNDAAAAGAMSVTVLSDSAAEAIVWCSDNIPEQVTTPGAGLTQQWTQDGLGSGPHLGNGDQMTSCYLKAGATPTVTATVSFAIREYLGIAAISFVPAVPSSDPLDYEDPCTITDPRLHVKVTTETETLHYGTRPMRDPAAQGGFKEPRVLTVDGITKAASDLSTGAWSAQTATVTLADTDRVNRGRSADRYGFRNCDAEIYLTSRAQQLAGGPPRILFSGKVYSDTADPNLGLSLTINDLIGIDYSLFSEEKMIPQREVLREFIPNAPESSVGQGEPILGGRLAPLMPDGTAKTEGVVDALYLGRLALKGTPGTVTGTDLATLVAALQASKTAGTLYVDFGGTFGFADCQSLQDYSGSVPSDFDELCRGVGSFVGLGYDDVQAYLGNAAVTGATEYEVALVAGHAIAEILNGSNGDPSVWIGDTQLDPAQLGIQWWAPQIPGDTTWSAEFGADPFTDLTSSLGNTRRFTFILFAAGSTYGNLVAGGGRVHLDCVGLETVGDGSGTALTDYFDLYRHVLNQFILQNYQTGLWLAPVQFLFADGVTLLDRVHADSFPEAAAVVAACYTSAGYQGSFKIGTRTSVRDVVQRFNFSGGCVLGQDDFGRLFVKVLDTRRPTFLAGHRTLRDKLDILPGFTIEPKPEWQMNYVQYEYATNYYTSTKERPASGGGAVAPVEYRAGQVRDGVLKKTLTFEYLRDDSTAVYVAAYYRDLFANIPRVAKYARRGLCGLEDDVLTGVPITHYNGYGTGGWQNHAVWILQRTYRQPGYCEYLAFDVDPVLTAVETETATAMALSPVALKLLVASDDPTLALTGSVVGA